MNYENTFSPGRSLNGIARASARRLLLLSLLVLVCVAEASAQAGGDYNKLEVYGGYSLARVTSNVNELDATSSGGTQSFTNLCSAATGQMLGTNSQRFFCERRNFNGFDASVTYNVSRYVGIKGNVTGHYKSETFVDDFGGITQTITVRERLYNFLGGAQLKDNAAGRRLKPFAHALAGAARYTDRQSQTVSAFPQFNYVADDRVTGFALKLGGGLDVRAGRHVDMRVVEFDYNPVFARDRSYNSVSGPFTFHAAGKTSHNYTVGFGIAFH